MSVTLDSGCLVTIFGGSGFVGRYVVHELAKTGCRIRIAVRHPHLAGHLQTLGDVGQIMVVQANLRNEESVRAVMRGSDAVVNLVGILAASGKQKFDIVQHQGAGLVAKAAKDLGVKAFVHMSALGADRLSSSLYAKSKGQGEELVLSYYPKAVILRPSIIFGHEDQFFNRFAQMRMTSPVLPAIGGGKTRFQPVYVGDVARAVVAGLDGRAMEGATYELGGLKTYSFKELLSMVAQFTGRSDKQLYLPFWAAKIGGFFAQLLPSKPLTVDQVRLLQKDNVVSAEAVANGKTFEGLGLSPLALESIVPSYLETYKPKGQFSKAYARLKRNETDK